MSSKITRKKKTLPIFFLLLVLVTAAAAAVHLVVFAGGSAGARVEQDISREMLTGFRGEQERLEQEKKRLAEYERSLKVWEAELDRKYSEYLERLKTLEKREEAFNKKVDDRVVSRQVIETYENIEPEQAAVLIKNIYSRDNRLAVLILRKIAGRKAGRILEVMVLSDKELAVSLAREVLEYNKPK